MRRFDWQWCLAGGGLLISILACGPSSKKGEALPVCERPAATWTALKPNTQERLVQACEIQNKSCRKVSTLACRTTWVYAAQFTKVLDWQREHPSASTIDRLDAYVNYFLKPTLRTHEEVWANAIEEKKEPREVMRQAAALMREESKGVTEDHLVALRDRIRKTPGPKEKELLIEAYTLMRRLNTKAFEPFDTYDDYRAEVRTKLELYEKIKIKLEFVEESAVAETTPATSPSTSGANNPTTPTAQAPAQGKVTIQSQQPGVILVDGRDTKINSPGTVEVPAGQHTIQIIYQDGKSSELKLIQVDPAVPVQVAFTSEATAAAPTTPDGEQAAASEDDIPAGKGRVTVYSAPAGLILLDSVNTGKMTPNSVDAAPGQHELQVLFGDGEASPPKVLEFKKGERYKVFFRQDKSKDEKDQWSLE